MSSETVRSVVRTKRFVSEMSRLPNQDKHRTVLCQRVTVKRMSP